MNFIKRRFAASLAVLIAAISLANAVGNAVNYGKTLTALPLVYHVGLPLAMGGLLILLEYALIGCGKIFIKLKKGNIN